MERERERQRKKNHANKSRKIVAVAAAAAAAMVDGGKVFKNHNNILPIQTYCCNFCSDYASKRQPQSGIEREREREVVRYVQEKKIINSLKQKMKNKRIRNREKKYSNLKMSVNFINALSKLLLVFEKS